MARGSGSGGDTLKFLAALAGGLFLLYKVTGLRNQNSPFIPDAIEDQIDSAVAALDRAFGKRWVDQGLNRVEQMVRASLNATAPGLAEAIFAAEQVGRQTGMSGLQKRQHAIRRLS